VLTLKDLKPGDRGRIVDCLGNGPVFQRLCEMGFVGGARLRVVRYAPFGDPIQVAIGSQHLSLRKAEASLVRIEREIS